MLDNAVEDDDRSGGVYEHHVNTVSAYLMCSVCVRKKRWLSPTTEQCEFCQPGQPRMRTWIFQEDGGVDGGDSDPLEDFMHWILYGLGGGVDRKLKTYAFAHYSGRYDIHLVAGFCCCKFPKKKNIFYF